jgi:hypothetical protein
MCFSVSTNTETETETEKPLNFNSFSKLLNFRVFATLTYSTRNQLEPVKTRWNLLVGGDFSTLKKT